MTNEPMGNAHLDGTEAQALLAQGKERWNEWVRNNPEGSVSFESCHFSSTPDFSNPLNFSGLLFPKKGVSFRKCRFESKEISFVGINFDCDRVDFSESSFYCQRVSFNQCKFRGHALFNSVNFSGAVDFRQAKFEGSVVHFLNSTFKGSFTHFGQVHFGAANVDFRLSEFQQGNVYFTATDFTQVEMLNFTDAYFGKGKVSFDGTKFPKQNIVFEQIECNAYFAIENITEAGAISFKGSSFDNNVSFNNIEIDGVIDLVGTKFSHPLSLHGLKCNLKREKGGFSSLWLKKAVDHLDIARFNRLKELAEVSKNHELALSFHANEHRAKRWNQVGFLTSIIDSLFSAVCDYGRSFIRPFIIWLLLIPAFAYFYRRLFPCYGEVFQNFWDTIIFSTANNLPFVASSKAILSQTQTKYLEHLDQLSSLSAIILVQGLLSVVFIFLIALGLRNWFRL